VVDDAYFMRKAIALAERGRGHTNPNPLVGALVVDDEGVIVGRGAHQKAGGPHAEVIAMEDPHPLVHGGGLRHLRERGLEVVVGVEQDAAARQNAVFLTTVREQRPHVTLKAALSIDGFLGLAERRIHLTGKAAARRAHRQRAEIDAIGVGSGTVLADDPALTPRGAYRARPLTRVIFDRRLRTPPTARILSTGAAGPIILVCSAAGLAGAPERARALTAAGARILSQPDGDLGAAVRALGNEGISSLVIEGGGVLHRAALAARVVDAVHLYIAPRALGPRGIAWLDRGQLAWEQLRDRRAAWLDADLFVEGLVER
jgi:diaminohydroxyphosphoribosylaminopyrimidine deaminase/5-amino-6-(5-phosphoribosylamino)uracil reductase